MNAFADYIRRGDDAIRYYIGPHAYNALTGAMETLSPAQDYQSALEGSSALSEAVQRGDWRDSVKGGALMAAGLGAMFMPGNQRPVMAAADSRRGITAYHGSPHDFDQFDISKIGTGEGAQAYGHGLYFAENEGVARSYRDALSGGRRGVDPPRFKALGREPRHIGPDTAHDIAEGGMPALEKRIEEVSSVVNDANQYAEHVKFFGKEQADEALAYWKNELDELTALKNSGDLSTIDGRMYQVRIDANPEDFLDWDRPLSEQPRIVQEMARNADLSQVPTRLRRKIEAWRGEYTPPEGLTVEQPTGNELHSALTNFGTDAGNNAAVTERLKEAGIPGIRYLDAGSRGAGDGSRNYVVFDDNLVTILKKYGLVPAAVTAGAALNAEDVQAAIGAAWGDMNREDRRAYLEAQNLIPDTAD